MLNYAWLILLFPALGALINAFFGRRLNRGAAVVANVAVFASFVVAVAMAFGVAALPESRHGQFELPLWDWITIGNLQIDMTMLIDPLSVVMALVVTGVGFVIHLFSATYMQLDDDHKPLDARRYARFFTFMNFFILMMLTLVLANNYIMLYLGWEGVGLASYLLIGFWFYKPSAADAAKKAFLVNRVGDFGLALAVMWLFYLFGTTAGSLAFNDIFHAIEGASPAAIAALTGVTLLLLLAATGKSAQLPLFVWLPDAMEGPSPVSALIHAATMVTAGVYMLARSYPLLELSPTTMTVIAWVGALTALMGATIAVVQTDLKRILAYSTISQLGFMFLAIGVGAYMAGIFHLVTHAFFKALLFLSAGSIMHATHGQLNIDLMGGFKKKMPITYWQFLVGALALSGFPLLAGFWSKDEILLGTFVDNPLLYYISMFTAFLTAFYTFRAVYRVFFGQPRNQRLYDRVHEQPFGMTGPLWILVIAALFGGFIGISAGIGDMIAIKNINQIETWLHPAFEEVEMLHTELSVQIRLFLVSGLLAILGILLAYFRYVRESGWTLALQRLFNPIQPVLENKYWVDEFYMAVIIRPLRAIAGFFYRIFDQGIIEGVVNGIGRLTTSVGQGVAHIETGHLSWYALSLFIGAVALVGFFLLVG